MSDPVAQGRARHGDGRNRRSEAGKLATSKTGRDDQESLSFMNT